MLLFHPCPLTWNHLAWRRAVSDWRHFSGLKMSPGSGAGTSIPFRRKGQVGKAPPSYSIPSLGHTGAMPLSSLGLILFILWTSLYLSGRPVVPPGLSFLWDTAETREIISVKILSPLRLAPMRKEFNACY